MLKNLSYNIATEKIFFFTLFLISICSKSYSQTTIVNYDFNSGASYTSLTPVLESGIISDASSTEPFASVSGITTGSNAFTANTAGTAITMSNSSGTNARYFQFQLGGSS